MRLVEGVAAIDDLTAFLGRLDEVATQYETTVQTFDARYVVDRTHLERAAELADRALDRGENVARDRAVEILLYAAGRRQIDDALELGVDEGKVPVVILVDGGDEDGAVDALSELVDPTETLGRYDEERVRAYFEVTDAELDAVAGDLDDVVHERVALLDVEK
ncbi:MAG: KEOPS complex subunit Cgi121 [Halobacteriota archaeon]